MRCCRSGQASNATVLSAAPISASPAAIGAAVVFAGFAVLRSGRPPEA
jgi:hypothetical protein